MLGFLKKANLGSIKTTIAGIATISAVAAKLVNDPTSLDLGDIAAISAGIGLIKAKDHNVTGGTKQI